MNITSKSVNNISDAKKSQDKLILGHINMNVIANNIDGLICSWLPYLDWGGIDLSTDQIFLFKVFFRLIFRLCFFETFSKT